MGNVIATFPEELITIVGNYNGNNIIPNSLDTLLSWKEWREVSSLSTKEIQLLLKKALKKVETLNIEQKLGIVQYDKKQISLFRRQCKNVKLRHIFYRLISKDFYTKECMLKFGMSRDSDCDRCGEVETYQHLF